MSYPNIDPYYYRPIYASCVQCDEYDEVNENQVCFNHDDEELDDEFDDEDEELDEIEIDNEESPFMLIYEGFSCQ